MGGKGRGYPTFASKCIALRRRPLGANGALDVSWSLHESPLSHTCQTVILKETPCPTLFAQGPALPVPQRTAQVDALRLDEELADMLRSQVASLTRSLGPAGGAAAARFLPELDLALGSVVLLASAVRTGSTPGADLMNLRYVTTSPRKADSAGPGPGLGALRSKGRDASPYAPPVLCLAMLAAVSLGIRYGWSKLVSCCVKWGWASAPEGSWRRNVWRWMRHVEQAHALCR